MILKDKKYIFTLGNETLNVTLVNGVSNQPLVNQDVFVLKNMIDGSLAWVSNAKTDSNGSVIFDLEFVNDFEYILTTEPFNGGWVYSSKIRTAGNYTFKVGTSPITLRDSDLRQPIPNRILTVMEKGPEGELTAVMSGTTDENGKLILDIPGLEQGGIFTIHTENISTREHFFSPWISSDRAVFELIGDLMLTPETSGGLLMAVSPEKVNIVQDLCPEAYVIGEVLPGDGQIEIVP